MREKNQPSPEKVLEWMRDYHKNCQALNRLQNDYHSAIRGGGATSQYGEESNMPKAKGKTGDPVYQNVKVIMGYETGVLDNLLKSILYIENRIHRIKKERHAIVLCLRMKGYTSEMIAERIGISRTGVQNILKTVAETIIEEEDYV